ncbi:MAG: type I-D CRISPR-associated helicase Cas3' [Candidatus Helarchaeota archaeon]
MELNKIILKPVYLENSNYKYGTILFRKFQKEFIDTETHWNILITPTGSGKTLAVLAKVLLRTETKKGLFIYPTNELINDQLQSLESLVSKLGFKPIKITPDLFDNFDLKQNFQAQLFKKLRESKDHVALLAINGVFLHKLSYYNQKDDSKGRIFSDLLNILNTAKIPSIILTNIDTLYLILKNKYKDSLRILNFIINWRHIVIDEFHLYSDISLVNLIFTISLYYIFIMKKIEGEYSINFLSATPSDALDLISQSFSGDVSIVQSIPIYLDSNHSTDNRYSNIRKQTKLFFINKPIFLYSPEDLEFLYNIIIDIINSPEFNSVKCKNKKVRLLILLNSMIFAENFYQYVLNRFKENNIDIPVARIHGMIPPIKRMTVNNMNGHILIGTRAIEIGVDFDVPFMVFEAFDDSSFLQRLGRGGRHDCCTQYCITKPLFINSITQYVSNLKTDTLDFSSFAQKVHEYLPTEESRFEFIFSTQGLVLLKALIRSLIGSDNEEQQKSFLLELANILKYNGKSIPTNSWETCIKIPSILKFLTNAISARCNTIEFPCYFQEFQYWGRLSLFDLPKCEFEISSFNNLKNIPPPPPIFKYIPSDFFILVKNFRIIKSRISIDISSSPYPINRLLYSGPRFKFIINGNINTKDRIKLNNAISPIKVPFIITNRFSLDWKIPALPFYQNQNFRVVLGEYALLVQFLIKNSNK